MKPSNWPSDLPYLDPSVSHVGISHLRTLNAARLAKLDKALVVTDNNTPLAVIVPYATYLRQQEIIERAEPFSKE